MNFFSHSQLQYKLCDLINLLSLGLLHHIGYPLTHRSHNSHQLLATASQRWCFRAGSPNYGPRSHFVNNKKTFRKNLL